MKKELETKATRDGFGEALLAATIAHDNLFVLSADLTDSLRVTPFKETNPERFVQMGVSEQSLAAIGAGMAISGAKTVLASYAAFSPGRSWEQVKTTIAMQKADVLIAGGHAGVTVGPDGATHQMLEDIAIMRVLPNMQVFVPCDAKEAKEATLAGIKYEGPVYLRLTRSKTPNDITRKTSFEAGKAQVWKEGTDLAFIGCGPLVYEALRAAEALEEEGISVRVINCPSVKPLDERTILTAARDCGGILTIEEAQIAGGLGSAIAELVAEEEPVPMLRMGIMDRYGESGEPEELLEHFRLTAPHIQKAAQTLLTKKRRI